KEFTQPRIGKAVDCLYAQTYFVTKHKQAAIDAGNRELAEAFAHVEAVARAAVEELHLLEVELFAPAFQGQGDPTFGGRRVSLLGEDYDAPCSNLNNPKR
ncbi:MAG: hypothetical protein LBJ82_01340, partial [Deltaproteobacteria bacterium]|nr:hypothetical protein [Deltaproteobacteria bacterium]